MMGEEETKKVGRAQIIFDSLESIFKFAATVSMGIHGIDSKISEDEYRVEIAEKVNQYDGAVCSSGYGILELINAARRFYKSIVNLLPSGASESKKIQSDSTEIVSRLDEAEKILKQRVENAEAQAEKILDEKLRVTWKQAAQAEQEAQKKSETPEAQKKPKIEEELKQEKLEELKKVNTATARIIFDSLESVFKFAATVSMGIHGIERDLSQTKYRDDVAKLVDQYKNSFYRSGCTLLGWVKAAAKFYEDLTNLLPSNVFSFIDDIKKSAKNILPQLKTAEEFLSKKIEKPEEETPEVRITK